MPNSVLARSPEIISKAKEYAKKFPNVIFSSLGEGLGMNGIAVSFHKTYTEYYNHLNQLRADWKDSLEDIQSFMISIGEGEYKRFSITYLKDAPL